MRDLAQVSESLAGGQATAVDLNLSALDSAIEQLSTKLNSDTSKYDAFSLVGMIESAKAKLDALRARAIVVAVGDVPVRAETVRTQSDVSIEDIHSTELGAYLNISPLAARNMAECARDLVRWLPSTMRLLESAGIDYKKASIVAEGASQIFHNLLIIDSAETGKPSKVEQNDPRVLAMMERYETLVTRRITTRTYSQVRQEVRKAVAYLTPLAIEHKFAEAKKNRGVEFFDQGDGTTFMHALMSEFDAAKVRNVLEYCARNDESLSGNMMNKMSDALVGILTGQSEISPEHRHSAAQVQVVVSLETLLGLSDKPADVIGSEFSITAGAIRELAKDSHLRRMVIDPSTGALLELGRRSYEPSRQIKDFVKLRDQKCRAPGCVRRAMACDVDHVKPWDDGGETNVDNLVSLCRRHHVLKTIGTWQYELLPNGDTVWRLPSGHVVRDYANTWVEPGEVIAEQVLPELDLDPIPF